MTAQPKIILLLGALGLAVLLHAGDALAETSTVTAAVHRARSAGMDEPSLSRILALSESHAFPSTITASLVDLLGVAAEEEIPTSRFVAKIEEGVFKRIDPERILTALMRKLDEYRFVQGLIEEVIRPRGGAFGPDHLVTLAECLDMGLDRTDLRTFLEQGRRVPPAMLVQGVESYALLSQAGFSTKGARAIVHEGFEQQAFTPEWRLLPLIAGRALEKGRSEQEIVAVVTEILHQGGGPKGVAQGLGVTWRNFQSAP
jgi:hypothetical protein